MKVKFTALLLFLFSGLLLSGISSDSIFKRSSDVSTENIAKSEISEAIELKDLTTEHQITIKWDSDYLNEYTVAKCLILVDDTTKEETLLSQKLVASSNIDHNTQYASSIVNFLDNSLTFQMSEKFQKKSILLRNIFIFNSNNNTPIARSTLDKNDESVQQIYKNACREFENYKGSIYTDQHVPNLYKPVSVPSAQTPSVETEATTDTDVTTNTDKTTETDVTTNTEATTDEDATADTNTTTEDSTNSETTNTSEEESDGTPDSGSDKQLNRLNEMENVKNTDKNPKNPSLPLVNDVSIDSNEMHTSDIADTAAIVEHECDCSPVQLDDSTIDNQIILKISTHKHNSTLLQKIVDDRMLVSDTFSIAHLLLVENTTEIADYKNPNHYSYTIPLIALTCVGVILIGTVALFKITGLGEKIRNRIKIRRILKSLDSEIKI